MALDSGVQYISYATGGAAAASSAHRLCKIAANRRMATCVANDRPDGVFYQPAAAAGSVVETADWHHSQSLRVEAGGAIADGHYVRSDAQGRVISDGAAQTDNSVGKCIGAITAAGQIGQIMPIPPYNVP